MNNEKIVVFFALVIKMAQRLGLTANDMCSLFSSANIRGGYAISQPKETL